MTPLTQAIPVERYVYAYMCTRIHIPVVPVADEFDEGWEGEASGVRRNARNWNDQLFDSRGASLSAQTFLPVSLDLSSKKQVREFSIPTRCRDDFCRHRRFTHS